MSAVLASAARGTGVALEARDLAHRYGRRIGLEPVSFTLEAPGVLAITGANGSGKSTLLRILAGLLRATAGTVSLTVEGRAIAAAERRRWVGYAAPELSFYDELSVEENLVFVAQARGLIGPAAAATAALTRVGLDGRARDRVPALSSGMKQRLRIAFALLHRPPLLLLDEPGSHLDDEGRATLAGLVEQERRAGLVLMATNDEREWRLAEQRIELRGRGVLPVECIQEQARRSGIARGDRPLFQRKRGTILNRREQIVTELQAHDVPSLLDGRLRPRGRGGDPTRWTRVR